MSYPVPSFDELRNIYLRTLQNINPDFDIAPDSDNFVRASASAAVGENILVYATWVFRQIFPDTADEENLQHHAGTRSMFVKPATFAVGTAKVKGAAGALLPTGTQIVTASGVQVATFGESVTLAGAEQTVNVRALIAGESGNMINATGNLAVALPSGAVAVSGVTLSGGTSTESRDALLARFLELLRNPPAGGKPADLKRWAEEVPGVKRAIVFTRLRGLGTSDVYIEAEYGLPTAQLLAEVLARLLQMSPAGIKDVAVRAPTETLINVAYAVKGTGDFATILKPQCEALTRAYFATFGAGEPFVLSKFEALISAQANISDRKVTLPSGNVSVGVDPDTGDITLEWVRLGTLTVTQMV